MVTATCRTAPVRPSPHRAVRRYTVEQPLPLAVVGRGGALGIVCTYERRVAYVRLAHFIKI